MASASGYGLGISTSTLELGILLGAAYLAWNGLKGDISNAYNSIPGSPGWNSNALGSVQSTAGQLIAQGWGSAQNSIGQVNAAINNIGWQTEYSLWTVNPMLGQAFGDAANIPNMNTYNGPARGYITNYSSPSTGWW
jgi:hypothetical protein